MKKETKQPIITGHWTNFKTPINARFTTNGSTIRKQVLAWRPVYYPDTNAFAEPIIWYLEWLTVEGEYWGRVNDLGECIPHKIEFEL